MEKLGVAIVDCDKLGQCFVIELKNSFLKNAFRS
jgi:hypothetical protein